MTRQHPLMNKSLSYHSAIWRVLTEGGWIFRKFTAEKQA
ncbi:hypothetical protein ANCDUO_19583 [Ancylostoma duodenale]|uniref:Uncharacterized protein n=1 Tax=Ancylostoma duodenale TaxID=51022 RepID=A0A0C2FUH7_9BILA|nr:hypothetical protein ANCDUO_19583 [Ancylostoma duodenale]